jgi:NNP family nitrate/nitrite transporter-like MFS transporter
MIVSGFRRAGHWPTLLAAFVYFDVSFMVWVLLGALGNALAADFGLSPQQILGHIRRLRRAGQFLEHLLP